MRTYLPFRALGRSIRVRLTLWYVSLLAIVLVAFAVATYFFLIAGISADVNSVTQSYQKLLTYYAAQSPRSLRNLKAPKGANILGQIGIVYQARNQETGQAISVGQVAYPTASKDIEGALFDTTRQGCHQIKGNHLECTWLVFRPRSHQLEGGVNFQASLSSVDHAEGRLRTALVFGIPVSLLIALVGGWVVASRALSPVEELRRTAQSITATDLSRRIGMHRDDELGRLAHTLDDMIDRIDSAFKEQRQLTADVSHELRTPLSVIRAQTSLALRRNRRPEEYAAVLASIQEETERMSKIVEDLLLLARADAGQEAIEHDPVRLDVIARWAADQMQNMARASQIDLELSLKPVMIEGDADRLRQLGLNLVHNAVKYTDSGGRVKVSVGVQGTTGLLQVSDSGQGIEEQSLPHIFQRFYMADRSRSRETGGSGLGLAIAHWIVEAHGGTIRVQSKRGVGSTFEVRIPLHFLDGGPTTVGEGTKPVRQSAGLPAGSAM